MHLVDGATDIGSGQSRQRRASLTLWAISSARPADLLLAGQDLVLEIAPADGLALADGVAVDDYLDSDSRTRVDAWCRSQFESWRSRHLQALTVEEVDLTEVWEVELIAQCFLPAARLLHGLPPALAAMNADRLVTSNVSEGMARVAAAVAAHAGVEADGESRADFSHEPVRRRPPWAHALAGSLGMPPRVRGEVLYVPYRNSSSLLRELLQRPHGPRIVSSRLLTVGIGGRNTAAVAGHGGWIGYPGQRARRRSRLTVTAALATTLATRPEEPLEAALDCFALETLERLSLDTLAEVRHARRALRRSRVSLGLLPFDSPEQVRMLLPALREVGARTLLIQHGFSARMGDPDMRLADHLAIWSEHDRSLSPQRDPATVTITGNPGVTHLYGRTRPRRVHRGRSVVLVDYPARLSTSIGGRFTMSHIATAVTALARTRPGTAVLIRPHPSDLSADCYELLAASHASLRISIDASSPIESLLADADLCIGGLSTATLQACVLDVPTVFLDTAGIERPWPFQGSSLPVATDVPSLAESIVSVLGSSEIAGRQAAAEALGMRPDAIERLAELVVDLLP